MIKILDLSIQQLKTFQREWKSVQNLGVIALADHLNTSSLYM